MFGSHSSPFGHSRNGVVLAVLLVEQPVREVRRRPLVHERLGVAVRADQVVPPLVAGLVRDEVLDVAAGEVRHAEDPLVDHDQAGALVAVPAEVRLGDGELRRTGTAPNHCE